MNPVLKHFALQAGGSHYPEVGGDTLESFYRIVVRDIMEFTDDLIDDGRSNISEAIKERYLDGR
jgi:hypothetical protein